MAKNQPPKLNPFQRLKAVIATQQEKVAAAGGPVRHPIWNPNPGPQEAALNSEADEIGYGGQAGGGKTDLALGMAITRHRKSIFFRREAEQLDDAITRSKELLGETTARFADDAWTKIPGGRSLEFAGIQHESDVRKWKGRPHDLKIFDEASDFSEFQVRFVMAWNRSTVKGVKCQALLLFNPPTTVEGQWIIRYFAPWIDPKYPGKRALPGELRWFARVDDHDVERPDGQPFEHKGETIIPKSRTFFPASLDDNPYLKETNYRTVLMALPEPLRSQVLYGDFSAGIQDDRWQCIPTAWVKRAMARPATSASAVETLGVDVARGGRDQTVLAPLNGTVFAPLIKVPGKDTPDGQHVVGLVVLFRREGLPVVDVVGVGSSAYDQLTLNGIDAVAFSGAAGSTQTDKSGKLGFRNLRAEAYWRFREALDPDSGENLTLPDDQELLADLCAPKWSLSGRGIQVESKEDIFKRLGRSTDCGDAVVMAWWGKRFAGTPAGEVQFFPGSIFDGAGSIF